MRETLTIVVGGAAVLGPAAFLIWLRQRPRPVRPMEFLLDMENPRDGPAATAPTGRSKGVTGCVGFGLLIIALLASPLVVDRLPGQP